jgi:hypothetical protein
MKVLYIILIFLPLTTLSANDLTWVDQQIEAIKPSREGISNMEISKIKDPFIFLVKDDEDVKGKKSAKKTTSQHRYIKTRHNRKLYLKAILNKSALINGRWYKEGSSVYGYKLTIINLNTVILKRKNKKILLSTKSKSKNVNITNNRDTI